MIQTTLLDQCQPQWYLQDPDEAEKAFLFYNSPEEKKDGVQSVISYKV